MLQLHSIYIQNFKGVYNPAIVQLYKERLTILSGPNGFGKTTIFDAIELCLCSKIERTMTYNDVTLKNSDHRKPFYQNKAGEDVIIKVWLKHGDTNHIIIKRLDKSSNGRVRTSRAFRPDAWEILETYYSTNEVDFDKAPDFKETQQVDQQFIDNLFFEDSGLSMGKLYPLFNYLQQEDNIFFLKKDENSKKQELSFLFQTQKEDQELAHLTEKLGIATAIREALKSRITELGEAAAPGEPFGYQKLFENTELKFDEEEPFSNVPVDQLNSLHANFQQTIGRLISFAETFKVEEFERQRLKYQIQSITSNTHLLETIVCQRLLSQERFMALRQTVERNTRFQRYLEKLVDLAIDTDLNLQLGLTEEFNTELLQQFGARQQMVQQTNRTTVMLRELNTARQEVIKHFELVKGDKVLSHHCPLCDNDFQAIDNLRNAFEKKTALLESFDQSQQQLLKSMDNLLETRYFSVIRSTINNYLTNPENFVDNEFYYRISERRGNLGAIQRFMEIANTQQFNFEKLLIDQPITLAKLNENIALLKTTLEGFSSKIVIDESALSDQELYEQYYQQHRERLLTSAQLREKLRYIDQKLNETKVYSLNVLRNRLAIAEDRVTRTANLRNQYIAVIKDYKKRMIEKIKIPFYIYSGKILQHYQQGYGIFMDVKDSTSRVRFLTNEDTDHDIIHQLSSGQLAVVSLAFCLALNKVYQTPNHFKFLAIDDPVQTLDDLNVHSFIELLRHEFSDYHMVISTHEEHIANYMDYKFGKFNFTSRKLNVQKIFYDTQARMS